MIVKNNYRIINKSGLIMYTGTTLGSWFTIEQAKKLVDYSNDEKIYEYSKDYMYKLFEVL